MGNAPDEPTEILALLNIGAVVMGIALTIRDLIGERPIFRREQAVGLSTWPYLRWTASRHSETAVDCKNGFSPPGTSVFSLDAQPLRGTIVSTSDGPACGKPGADHQRPGHRRHGPRLEAEHCRPAKVK